MKKLTHKLLQEAAKKFALLESEYKPPALYGITDGKAIGTYLEHKFQDYLQQQYDYVQGNSAKGIDFPGLEVDIKVTSIRQPQSSCPYRSARQKIYGLGYALLIFVYDKTDDKKTSTGQLNILHTIFVSADRTADWQTTTVIQKIIENDGNQDDLIAFFLERMLPADEIEIQKIAAEVMENMPGTGYLTISNALQWRLQYRRVIDKAGEIDGIVKIV